MWKYSIPIRKTMRKFGNDQTRISIIHAHLGRGQNINPLGTKHPERDA